MKADVAGKTTQETQGAGEAVAEGAEGIGKGIGSAMGGAALPSAVSALVSCVCCGALLAFGLSPAGQKATGNFGSAAARRF